MAKEILVQRIDGTLVPSGYTKRRKPWNHNDFILIGMAFLSVVFLAVFAYAPLYGLVLAFKDGDGYLNILTAIQQAPWNGLANFEYFLTDPDFKNIMWNTIGLNVLQLLINFPAPIIFAILMSELMSNRFKKVVQTVTFFPHFISWVIFGGIFLSLLDFDVGIVNNLLVDIGIVKEPIDILGEPKYFWGLIISTSILKGLGWGSIIYVAAISGIPNELYEAAKIDGANRWHKIWYITVPSIMPTVTLFFILSIAGLLNNGIEHLWVFQNANNLVRSEVLDTFIYKFGIPHWRYSYATALGLFKSVISVFLLVSGNAILKKITGKGIY
jgi:putative aldouronate transport system permease protein